MIDGTVSLATYRTTVKAYRGRSQWCHEDGGDEDILQLFLDTVSAHPVERVRDLPASGGTRRSALTFGEPQIHSFDKYWSSISVIAERGDAGRYGSVLDTDKRKKRKEGLRPADAPLRPIFMKLYVQEGHDYGVLLLQTAGSLGVKRFMELELSERGKGPPKKEGESRPLTVSLVQALSEDVVKGLLSDGLVKGLEFVEDGSQKRPSSRIDQMKFGARLAKDVKARVSTKIRFGEGIKGKRSVMGAAIKEVLEGNLSAIGKLFEGPQAPEAPQDVYSDAFVTVEVGKRLQRFSLFRPDDTPIRQVVDVTLDSANRPTRASLEAAFDEAFETTKKFFNPPEA